MDNSSLAKSSGEELAMDAVRAAYYRDGFVTLMHIVNVQAVIILALAAGLSFYLVTQESRDRFYAETSEGKVLQMSSLSSPNMGRDAISNWAAQAASQIMTFGFNDIDERFALSRLNFTEDGWEYFRKAVANSSLLNNMSSNQQIVTSVPESVPVLKKEGLRDGRYGWTFEIPLLITFRAGSAKSSRTKTVHMLVEKVPTQENPNGVGISEWYIY